MLAGVGAEPRALGEGAVWPRGAFWGLALAESRLSPSQPCSLSSGCVEPCQRAGAGHWDCQGWPSPWCQSCAAPSGLPLKATLAPKHFYASWSRPKSKHRGSSKRRAAAAGLCSRPRRQAGSPGPRASAPVGNCNISHKCKMLPKPRGTSRCKTSQTFLLPSTL